VSVELVLTTRTVDLVEEGFDLALRGGPLKDSGLIARKLGKADAGLFASPAYLEAHGRPTRLADLTAHAFVALQASGRATLKLTGPRGPERVELAPRLSTDHFPFVMRAVLHDVGVGLLPFFLCEDEVTRGALERVLPRYALKATPLHLVYPSARFLPRRVAALRDAIVASLGAELR
jgi:DNA-binding transcriptional LysR family regulator